MKIQHMEVDSSTHLATRTTRATRTTCAISREMAYKIIGVRIRSASARRMRDPRSTRNWNLDAE